jgi:hypothetical protein
MADLRELSAERTVGMGFPGYAIGGLSVGETKAEMYQMAGLAAGMLPQDAPRYLMGVGAPEDLVEAVARGVDMFDCALPTRIARNGGLFTGEGRVQAPGAVLQAVRDPILSYGKADHLEFAELLRAHDLPKAGEFIAARCVVPYGKDLAGRLDFLFKRHCVFEIGHHGFFYQDMAARVESLAAVVKMHRVRCANRDRVHTPVGEQRRMVLEESRRILRIGIWRRRNPLHPGFVHVRKRHDLAVWVRRILAAMLTGDSPATNDTDSNV